MKYKGIYIYPAIFSYDNDGISVEFPDLPGAYTCGNTEEEAFEMAKECLELHLYGMEKDNDFIPEHKPIKTIKLKKNQAIVMIKVFMKKIREEMRNKAVKKTLTIPKWLDEEGKKKKINFSAVLQKAIIEELELNI